MSFCNTDVESTLRHFLHHDIKAATCCHRRSDAHNLLILFRQFKQSLAENILISWRQTLGIVLESFASLGVVLARSMEDCRVLLSRLEALAFDGVQMQEFRPLHVFNLSKSIDKLDDIMPIDRSEVTDVQTLEDILLIVEQRL